MLIYRLSLYSPEQILFKKNKQTKKLSLSTENIFHSSVSNWKQKN